MGTYAKLRVASVLISVALALEPVVPRDTGLVWLQRAKKRKWNETYQQYGFTQILADGLDGLQCIHCSTVLANCSLKPGEVVAPPEQSTPEY
ncbi:hypothetical protein GWK47_029397 [Chionoecetes opilio]|uniref:Secreted protein n=1 Tax=Chionoecetes opilio TaxID=41210 RepID=A0A8J4Z475_CHIOP|nr:hypothetical protein GWK47_029397 [Chionoecetes opilio]